MNIGSLILAFGCLCILPIILLCLVGILVAIAGRRNNSRNRYGNQSSDQDNWNHDSGQAFGKLASDDGLKPNSPEDGFWLNTTAYAIGSIVEYRCLLNGQPVQRSVLVQTGEKQFVYTGDFPADVRILNVAPPKALEQQNKNPIVAPPNLVEGFTAPEVPKPSESFEGYPPAY